MTRQKFAEQLQNQFDRSVTEDVDRNTFFMARTDLTALREEDLNEYIQDAMTLLHA